MLRLEHLALRQTFNRRLILTAALIAVSQFNFGFDQQGFASTQAMDAFAGQFGVWNTKKQTYVLPTVGYHSLTASTIPHLVEVLESSNESCLPGLIAYRYLLGQLD